MIIVNTPDLKGRDYEEIEMVAGSIVLSKHIGKDIMAGFKTIVGGEIQGYTEMLIDARTQAVQRMQNRAEQLGADAIVNVRFATSAIMESAAEVVAYGTAIKFK
ncbi:MAG: YbjQ family protein [Clostridiales bacterium]|nr:YbjQ family protein [Clostridiales bacterium]MDY6116936.1 YbjQ family protein [Anaerovoracaceae bacterium]